MRFAVKTARLAAAGRSSVRRKPLASLRTRTKVGRSWIAIAVTALLLSGGSMNAEAGFVIKATFDSSITNDANSAAIKGAINQAILVYENKFTDNITVNITFKEMGSGLGMSNTPYLGFAYNAVHNALIADKTTGDDATALAHLPGGAANPVLGGADMAITRANAKALGLLAANDTANDGTVSINTAITNFTRPPGNASKYDLQAVAMHEIDEVLGTSSALPGFSFGGKAHTTTADLFRYDDSGNRSFTTSTTAKAYFSIDGTTRLAQYDQSGGGDYGDWKKGAGPVRVQDAVGTAGTAPNLGVELRVLDVVGYDLRPVPEPSTFALAGIGGLAFLGLARRRGR